MSDRPSSQAALPLAGLVGFEMALRALDLARAPKLALVPDAPQVDEDFNLDDDEEDFWDNVPV